MNPHVTAAAELDTVATVVSLPGSPPEVELLGSAVLLRGPIVAEVRRLLALGIRDAVRRDGLRPPARALRLLAVLDAAAGVRADVRPLPDPPGPRTVDSMSTREVAETLGLSDRQARRLADRLGGIRTTAGWRFGAEQVRDAAATRRATA